MVLTPSNSLGSYIVPTDQHESFVHTLSSLMRTRENFLVGHPSQIALSQAQLTWMLFRDRLPKKKMHLVDMSTLLILLSLGQRYHYPRVQDITIHPLRRPMSSLVNPNPGTSLLATSVCLVLSYAMPCDHSVPICTMRHIPKLPSPYTPVKPRGTTLIPLVTPHPIPGLVVLTPGSSLGPVVLTPGSSLGTVDHPTLAVGSSSYKADSLSSMSRPSAPHQEAPNDVAITMDQDDNEDNLLG
jgi:hypothetical protein